MEEKLIRIHIISRNRGVICPSISRGLSSYFHLLAPQCLNKNLGVGRATTTSNNHWPALPCFGMGVHGSPNEDQDLTVQGAVLTQIETVSIMKTLQSNYIL
ncbi:hypothetical protein Y1Q_0009405 [Alligator mississippiensis]|uniref:Uncharacterized protein n=1 Tax=Alligator mississippiensis TaxID=8496 RepID=A0A151N8I2_ALLMI|nr:hypothetical protein Y1Q_0009405 [Alligator mississippiensis]